MRFEFQVGSTEQHTVKFRFNKFWGNLRISIDDKNVLSDVQSVSFSLTKKYRFMAGRQEQHKVIIEMTRPLLFAGFRSSTYHVYIDGELLHTYQGY